MVVLLIVVQVTSLEAASSSYGLSYSSCYNIVWQVTHEEPPLSMTLELACRPWSQCRSWSCPTTQLQPSHLQSRSSPAHQGPTQGHDGSPPKDQMGAIPIYTPGNRPTICKLHWGPKNGPLFQDQLYWLRSWRQSHLPRTRQDPYPSELLVKACPPAAMWPDPTSLDCDPKSNPISRRPVGRRSLPTKLSL